MKLWKKKNEEEDVPLTVRDIRRLTKEILKSKKKTRLCLIASGIYDKNGNLTKNYK